MLTFESAKSFLDWFFLSYRERPAVAMFSDYCVMGCWRFVPEDPDAQDFPEIFDRYTAARELHLAPARNFDDAPARMLDLMLVLSSEINTAIADKAKRDNGR